MMYRAEKVVAIKNGAIVSRTTDFGSNFVRISYVFDNHTSSSFVIFVFVFVFVIIVNTCVFDVVFRRTGEGATLQITVYFTATVVGTGDKNSVADILRCTSVIRVADKIDNHFLYSFLELV